MAETEEPFEEATILEVQSYHRLMQSIAAECSPAQLLADVATVLTTIDQAKCLQYIEASQSLAANNAQLLYRLANLLFALGRYEQAGALYASSCKQVYHYVAEFKMIKCLALAGSYGKALRLSKGFIERYPDNHGAIALCFKAAVLAGRLGSAKHLLLRHKSVLSSRKCMPFVLSSDSLLGLLEIAPEKVKALQKAHRKQIKAVIDERTSPRASIASMLI